MTKKKRNILIIVISSVILLMAATASIVYAAYTIVVEYNYNVKAYSDFLDISSSGGVLSVTRHGTELVATKADVVIITPDEDGAIAVEWDGETEKTDYYKFSTFEVNSTKYRKSVFTDLVLDGSSDTTKFNVYKKNPDDGTYSRLTSGVTALKAQMSAGEYYVYETDDDGNVLSTTVKPVKYDNIYVSNSGDSGHQDYSSDFTNCLEFELMNFQSNYNDVFELWDNYNTGRIVSRTLFLLDDVTVKQDYAINVPCSINLLSSTLTVENGATLKLAHSYAGRYYITGEPVTVGGVAIAGNIALNGSGDSQGKITVKTPKAYYSVANSFVTKVDIAEYAKDNNDYISDILSDAVNFAKGAVPYRTYSTFILPQKYKTYGVSFSYAYYNTDLGKIVNFSGRVSDKMYEDDYVNDGLDADRNALLRKPDSVNYDIEVTATLDGSSNPAHARSQSKKLKVIGSSEIAMFGDILGEIGGIITNPDENSTNLYVQPDLNIYNLLNEMYAAGGFKHDLKVSVYEDAYWFELTEEELDALALTDDEKAIIESDLRTKAAKDENDNRTEEELVIAVEEAIKASQNKIYTDAAVNKEANALTSGMPVTLVVGYDDGGTTMVSTPSRSAVFTYDGGLKYIVIDDTGEDPVKNEYPVKYVNIEKGLATVSEKLMVVLTALDDDGKAIKESDDEDADKVALTGTFDLAQSTRTEIIYYLKTVMPAFLTNKPYPRLNVTTYNDVLRDGIYSANSMLTPSFLGIKDIDFKFYYDPTHPDAINLPSGDAKSWYAQVLIDKDDETKGYKTVGKYFGYEDEEGEDIEVLFYSYEDETFTTPSTTTRVPDNMKMRYTVTFEDGEEEFDINVIRSIASEGGENQQFESSNPFDELFMSSDTVWVEGGNFTVPLDKTIHYAQIEIIEINGEKYENLGENSPERKMIRVEALGSLSNPEEGYDFWENFNIDGLTEETAPHMEQRLVSETQEEKEARYAFYKSLNVVTNRDYVPDYNTSVRFCCYYVTSSGPNSAMVLQQEYLIIVPGIFKCEEWEDDEDVTHPTNDEIIAANQDPSDPIYGMSEYTFFNTEFYDITIQMFEKAYAEELEAREAAGENIEDIPAFSPYISTLSSGKKILLSDSAYATGKLDYSGLTVKDGVDVRGIERLKRVTSINLSGVSIADMSAFAKMYDSALETLYLENCGLGDEALYGDSFTSGDASYLYEIQLKEVYLTGNKLSRTEKLLSRTVTYLDISNQFYEYNDIKTKTLSDIAGLFNLTSLRALDLRYNNIYRFDVLRKLATLNSVYIYDNEPYEFDNLYRGDYGTNGRLNIPTYVAVIKDYDTKIYPDENGTDAIKINREVNTGAFNTVANVNGSVIGGSYRGDMDGYFTDDNDITTEMEIGSVALNAFASPTRLYQITQHDGIKELINDVINLKVGSTGSGWEGGVDNGVTTEYYFRFYDPNAGTLSNNTITFIHDGEKAKVTTVNNLGIRSGANIIAGANGKACSYMLAITDVSGNILAYREFMVNVMYDI